MSIIGACQMKTMFHRTFATGGRVSPAPFPGSASGWPPALPGGPADEPTRTSMSSPHRSVLMMIPNCRATGGFLWDSLIFVRMYDCEDESMTAENESISEEYQAAAPIQCGCWSKSHEKHPMTAAASRVP